MGHRPAAGRSPPIPFLILLPRALGAALRRFGHGVYVWWRPLKNAAALEAVDAEARAQGALKMLRADLWTAAPTPEGRLVGSSLCLINPPFGLEDGLRVALPFLADALTKGQSGWRLLPPISDIHS